MKRLLLLFILIGMCACRTTRKADIFADSSRTQETSAKHMQSLFYAQLDSFLRTWAVTAEGFEAEVSIPLTTAHTTEEVPVDTTSSYTTSSVPAKNTQPSGINIRIRAKSLHAEGEHKGRVITEVADSSDAVMNTTSEEHDTVKQKKKFILRPAIIWWTGVGVFLLFILYVLLRWMKSIL